MKIAYLGYDFFYSCLKMLVEEGHEIIRLFSYETDNRYNFREYIERIAKDIKVNLKTDRITTQDIIDIHNDGCDLIVVAAYPYKVPVLKTYSIRGVNIHPTLLPEGRGPWPLPYIILRELKRSGVTIHKLTDKMDSGDILIQKEFDISKREDLETLSCKCQIVAVDMLRELVENIDEYWTKAIPQGEGSYWSMPAESLMTLDWNKSVYELDKISRAFGKFDSCAVFDNSHWVVQDINGWVQKHNYKCGQIVHRTNKEVMLAVKDGFVCLRFFCVDPDYK